MPELTPDDLTQIRRLVTFARDQQRRLAEWGEQIDTIITRLDLLEAAVRESSEDEANAIRELRAEVKRLEELELLRQAERGDSTRANKLRTDIKDEHNVEHLREMLITVTKNLQRAELRKARDGSEVSYKVLNDIEEYTAAKAEIEAQLEALKHRS